MRVLVVIGGGIAHIEDRVAGDDGWLLAALGCRWEGGWGVEGIFQEER